MSCGDCDFETHYESELFLHLKVHIGKEDEVGTTVPPYILVPTDAIPDRQSHLSVHAFGY